MIGIVTVTFNSADVLPDFLASLEAQTVPFHLYAVDNSSSDDSVAQLRAHDAFPIVIMPQAVNGGIAVGNNVGIRRAIEDGCERVLLLNNDTSFGPNLLEDLDRSAESASVGIVVPSVRFHDHPDTVWFEAARFATWRGSVPVALDPAPVGDPVPIECSSTCCALVAADVFADVGIMDERFFVYWDDTDFFYRCHRAGVPMILDPDISVLHKVSSLTGGGESSFSQNERIKNRVYFIRKHNGGLRQLIGLATTALNAASLGLRGPNRRTRVRALTRAFCDGTHIPTTTADRRHANP